MTQEGRAIEYLSHMWNRKSAFYRGKWHQRLIMEDASVMHVSKWKRAVPNKYIKKLLLHYDTIRNFPFKTAS